MSVKWITVISLLFIIPVTAQDKNLTLSFNELEEYLKQNSPAWLQSRRELILQQKTGDIDLQWSNMDINFEYEKLTFNDLSLSETTLLLEKRFEMPWIYSKRSQQWENILLAAEFQADDNWNTFVKKMRAGYIELALLKKQNQSLNNLKSVLLEISSTAENRYKEGMMSGFEQSLVQKTLFLTESALIQISQRYLDLETHWKILAGIENQRSLNLITDIYFIPVSRLLDSLFNLCDRPESGYALPPI